MKQVTNRIVDLFKGLKGSATLGQRDSLVELGPQVSSVIELPGPLKNANAAASVAAGTIVSDTVYIQLESDRVGAGALALVFHGALLDAGLWHIKGTTAFQWSVGASTFSGQNTGLVDPDGAATLVFARSVRVPVSGVVCVGIDLVVSLDRPGWKFVEQIDATLAADIVFCRLDVVANKLL